jgi:LAGLIDADG endonuclease
MDRDIDPFFGHWLAGFIAGEGCFSITLNHGSSWQCAFELKVRDDDGDIMYEIQSQLGLGKIYNLAERDTSRPQVTWRIGSLDECIRFIHVLDQFSLRARKSKDYHIWRRAVFAKSAQDFERIAILAAELKEERAYKTPASSS